MFIHRSQMSLLSLIAIGIGAVVGAGIFALLGQVILQAGDKTRYAFIIAGLIAMLSGYSYARLAGRYPDSGGLSDYFHIAFKAKAVSGGLTIIYWLTSMVSISMMAKSFGIYAAELFPSGFPSALAINLSTSGIIVLLAALNMLASNEVGRTEIFLVGVKMAIMLSLIAVAFWKLDSVPPHPPLVTGELSFWGSIGITFFAYAGYGVITNASAEVADSKTTISRAIYLTIFIVILLYMGLAFVVLKYIPPSELKINADTAVVAAASKILGPAGSAVMYLTAVIAFISGIGATFFSTFRISVSLSHQGILPSFYLKNFWRRGTWGHVFSVTVIVISTVAFDFSSIVNFASGAYLVSYLAVFAANWRLRRETNSSSLLILLGGISMGTVFAAFIANLL